jgi:hypothetical protein
MESEADIECQACYTLNPIDRTKSRNCGANLRPSSSEFSEDYIEKQKNNLRVSNQSLSSFAPYLVSSHLAILLRVVGWIYFLLSLVGGIYLIANAKQFLYSSFEYVVNYYYMALGIVGIFSSLIVLLICVGIARIIEQNIFIINSKK